MKAVKDVPIPYDIQLYGECMMRCGGKTIMQFYLERIASGVSPRLAETFAMQQAPGIGITTSVFLQDQRRWGSSIAEQYKGQPKELEALRQGLAKNGYRLKPDDQYIATAARRPNDPMAVVNQTRSIQDVERYVNEHQKRMADQPMKIRHRLNPKVVESIRRREIARNPDLAHRDQRELREEIIDKHGSKKDEL